MFDSRVHQDIALEEKYPCIAGSASVSNLLHLHLRLDVISKRSKRASSITKAGSFNLHLAAIAAVGGAFLVGEAIFFQNRRLSGISQGCVFGGLHALRIDAPAAKGLRQRTSG